MKEINIKNLKKYHYTQGNMTKKLGISRTMVVQYEKDDFIKIPKKKLFYVIHLISNQLFYIGICFLFSIFIWTHMVILFKFSTKITRTCKSCFFCNRKN